MKKKPYDYESDWRPYVYPESQAHFTTEKGLREQLSAVDLTASVYPAAGIPLSVSGTTAIVNNETENTIIYGETGSKKTRCVIRPLLYTLMGKGESMIVTDPKGELATDPVLRKRLEKRGYRTVFLDFRDFSADRYNIFAYAFELYRRGRTDKAMENAARVIHALVRKYEEGGIDPYWHIMAEEQLLPILQILFEVYRREEDGADYVNMLTLSSFIHEDGMMTLKEILDEHCDGIRNSAITMLRGVLSSSEKTMGNIASVTSSVLQPFLMQESLLGMLSSSTFSPEAMYEEPTCVFLVTPDETSTYDAISGILVDNFYARLVDTFTRRYQNGTPPPCRINFVCDEFCNMAIGDMGPKISACRSREIRFYLVCQSLAQLEKSCPDAAVILGNCKNVLFLQSSDVSLLDYISTLTGTTTVTDSGSVESLVTPDMLKHLKKERDYKEAIFIRDDLVYRATLPDWDTYRFSPEDAAAPGACIPTIPRPSLKLCTPEDLEDALDDGKLPPPFRRDEKDEKNEQGERNEKDEKDAEETGGVDATPREALAWLERLKHRRALLEEFDEPYDPTEGEEDDTYF